MKLPDRQDFLEYAEGTLTDSQIQKQVLQMLASSAVIRSNLAEIKRDLYLSSSQIPEYSPDVSFGAELSMLAKNWIQIVYERKFSNKNFYRTKEYAGLIAVLVGLFLLLVAGLGIFLL